jgi:hypothetical protein
MDNVEKGEIVYCNIEFEYNKSNYRFKKTFNKIFKNFIFARPYDCTTFPELDVIKYSMLINKIDRKNAYYLSNIKIVNLDILAKTGFIAKL